MTYVISPELLTLLSGDSVPAWHDRSYRLASGWTYELLDRLELPTSAERLASLLEAVGPRLDGIVRTGKVASTSGDARALATDVASRLRLADLVPALKELGYEDAPVETTVGKIASCLRPMLLDDLELRFSKLLDDWKRSHRLDKRTRAARIGGPYSTCDSDDESYDVESDQALVREENRKLRQVRPYTRPGAA